MKFWIITLSMMYFSWSYTDVRSNSALENFLYPTIFGILALVTFIKVLYKLGIISSSGSNGSGSSEGFFGGGDGGDGGGCD